LLGVKARRSVGRRCALDHCFDVVVPGITAGTAA
jgi:hypothetical protein